MKTLLNMIHDFRIYFDEFIIETKGQPMHDEEAMLYERVYSLGKALLNNSELKPVDPKIYLDRDDRFFAEGYNKAVRDQKEIHKKLLGEDSDDQKK